MWCPLSHFWLMNTVGLVLWLCSSQSCFSSALHFLAAQKKNTYNPWASFLRSTKFIFACFDSTLAVTGLEGICFATRVFTRSATWFASRGSPSQMPVTILPGLRCISMISWEALQLWDLLSPQLWTFLPMLTWTPKTSQKCDFWQGS